MESSENEQNTPKSDGTVVEMAQHAAQDGSRVDAAAAGSAEARAQAEADDDERAEKSVIQELEQEVPPGVGLAVAEEAVRGGFFARFKKRPAKEKTETVPFLSLFRFGTRSDQLLTLLGLAAAGLAGASMPFLSLIMGDVTNAILFYQPNPPVPIVPGRPGSADYLMSEVTRAAINFVILGAVSSIAAYIQYAALQISAIRQTKQIRDAYLFSILRQDIGWHDLNMTGELTARLTADVNLVQEGIGEKLGVIMQSIAGFITGFVIAFTKGWKLSLVLLAVFPVVAVAGRIMGGQMQKRTKLAQDAFGAAGGVAEQAISSVRTVQAFSGERLEVARYESKLRIGMGHGIKTGFVMGAGIGFIFFSLFSIYGLAFWFGGTLILWGEYNPGQVLNTFFALMIGVFSIMGMAPNISALSTAQGAAFRIFSTVDRKSAIDPLDPSGTKPSPIVGNISFKNVDFMYPSRPDVPVLENFSLDIAAGTKVALVGLSGSGKSTIVKLLERFYDPKSGSVTLDGQPLPSINVRHLRQQFGIVSQEPTLFDATIRENILLGLPDRSTFTEEELNSMVNRALQIANADFVFKLPQGPDSEVGERGVMLSGGQKQRIAIARAVIKNPPILLLDEATAALDTASERAVQRALDEASKGRTSIVVAHRLSTIKDSDAIYVMSHGKIVESGTHAELISKSGVYAELVKAQEIKTSEEAPANDSDDDEEETVSVVVQPDGQRRLSIMPPKDIRRASAISLAKSASKPGETAIEMEKLDGKSHSEPTKASSVVKDVWLRVIKLNKPEAPFLALGTIGAAASGAVMPLWGLIFSEMLTTFSKPSDELRSGTSFWAIMFVCLGIYQLCAFLLNIGFFTLSGERLTMRMRLMCYEAILRQNIAWFDDEKQSTGALTAKLADDATQVKGLFGQLLGSLIQSVVTTAVGIGIAVHYTWELSLVILATIPIVAFAGYLQFKSQHRFGRESKSSYEESNTVPTESISNVRTVVTLTKEEHFYSMYQEQMLPSYTKAINGVLVASLGQGFSAGARMFVNALAYWAGAKFMVAGVLNAGQVQGAIFTTLFMAMGLAQATQNAPSITKAKIAASSIFEIVDRVPPIDTKDSEGLKPTSVKGDVSFEKVEFAYPTRPLEMILRGLNIDAKPGQTVALVGPSGCGKSTTVSLLERYYDAAAGSVKVENEDVRDWNLETLRGNIAIVGQEPVIFDGSVAENIAYGKEGKATMDEITAAAKLADIYDTIMELPGGFETQVGEKGSLLSGGQKQRVAIARALVRQPRILLLDEATASLHSQSEKVVQEALDRAAAGRTTISIAHRLSTIQGADKIYVFRDGKVVESGRHMELFNQKGVYWELVQQQLLGSSQK